MLPTKRASAATSRCGRTRETTRLEQTKRSDQLHAGALMARSITQRGSNRWRVRESPADWHRHERVGPAALKLSREPNVRLKLGRLRIHRNHDAWNNYELRLPIDFAHRVVRQNWRAQR